MRSPHLQTFPPPLVSPTPCFVHTHPLALCSVLGISSEAARLRLMAAIVALRKQVSANAAERPVSPMPLPAHAQQLQASRDLPYLQLQVQPGGAALQQRDISSFFRPPPASSCTDEYSNVLFLP